MIRWFIAAWRGLPWMENEGTTALIVWAFSMVFVIAANWAAAIYWEPLPFVINIILLLIFSLFGALAGVLVEIGFALLLWIAPAPTTYSFSWEFCAVGAWRGTKFSLLLIVIASLLPWASFWRSMALSWGIFLVVCGIWGLVLWIRDDVSSRLRTSIRHSHIQEAIQTRNVSELQNLLRKEPIDLNRSYYWESAGGKTLYAPAASFAAYYAEGGPDRFPAAVEMVKVFKAAGVDLNASVFWVANNEYLQAMQALLAGGADKGVVLSAALRDRRHDLPEKMLEIAKQVVREGCGVNQVNEDGDSPLMRAICLRDTDFGKQILALGADVNIANEAGETALILAVYRRNLEMINMLLAAGADVNAVKRFGQTALLLAAERGYTEVIKILLEAGANVNAANDYGKTALMYALGDDNTEMVQLLLSAGAKK